MTSPPEGHPAKPEPNWHAHRREQLRRWAAMPLREQLAAIEELGEVRWRIEGATVGSGDGNPSATGPAPQDTEVGDM